MEVSVASDFGLGVKWGGAGAFDNGTGVVGGSFGGKSGGGFGNLAGLAEVPPVFGSGFSVGMIKQGIKIGNVLFPNIGAVLTAFKDDSDINIIATPQILTTDNKKARINVGENIPYITSQQENVTNTNYNNYEYKDVGTTLEITPQINQADLLRLEISIEVTKLKSAADVATPTTFKRTANTTVVVHNGETVVIGGIIGQDTSSAENKVPILGDIPFIGWLFKTQGRSQQKTNMFIFITPHIVENRAALAEIYYQKRDVMEYVQAGSSDIPDKFFYGRKNPAHANALTDLGFDKLQKRDYGQARDYFQKALEIDPNNPYALINLGVVNEREGHVTAAREMYEKVLQQKNDQEDEDAGQDASVRQMARENIEQLKNMSAVESTPPVIETP
jgi:general secretion pathway protein D